jgi:hypothetical protein
LNIRRRKWQEAAEDCIMGSFITCTLNEILLTVIKSKRTRMAEHVARMEEIRNVYNILVGIPRWIKPL